MKKLIYILTGMAVMLLGSCNKNETQPGGGNADGKLQLSVTVQGMTSAAATRGTIPAEPGEDQVNSLYLLFFEASDFGTGKYIDYVEVTGKRSMQFTLDLDLSAHPLLSTAGAYDILAVANISDNHYISNAAQEAVTVDTWMDRWTGMTEAQVSQEASAWFEDIQETDANAIKPDYLLMSGISKKESSKTAIQLELKRDLVRFDVYNDVNTNYDVVTASVWGAYPGTPIWKGMSMDYSSVTARIHRFYGIDNTANQNADGTLKDIVTGLYSFENQVPSPKQNDYLTTCLILGIKDRSSGVIGYFRANVAPDTGPQVLVRNNVYRITITGITGTGYATEELAYNGRGNNLVYKVNSWDLDDNGLIVQDENSLLSIPTKTINIGRNGGTSDYSIYITSKLPNPAPLAIVSQTYNPADGGIVGTINGNILHIDATPLAPTQTERRGVIILSYAGLQTSVNVIQSGDAETFLKVILPDGGILPYPPYANASSGLITVEASGPWSAQIYMDGFSFTEGNLVTKTTSANVAYVNNSKFRIYTNTANPETSMRQGFIVVTLDSDPDNYSAVIRVAQKAAGAIKVDPNQTIITFDGLGALVAAVAPLTNTNTLNVLPNTVAGPSGDYIPEWKATIIQSGSYDDRAMFTIVSQNWDTNNSANNKVTVNAVGMNTTGRTYTATLRIALVGDAGTYTDITLVQQSLSLTLTPSTLATPVSIAGGMTAPVTVNGDATMQWSATIVTNSGTATDGRHLVHHEATLVDDTGAPLTPGTNYPMSKKFCVQFPKVYYPNRDITISATVTVKVGGMQQTISATQTTLTARPVVGFDIGNEGASYGQFGSGYAVGWEGRDAGSAGYGLISIPGYTYASPQSGPITTSTIGANVTYLQVTPGNGITTFDWSPINNFIDTRNAWTVFQPQSTTANAPMNLSTSPLKRNGIGYNNMVYANGAGDAQVTTVHSNTKVYQFIMDKATNPLTPAQITTAFYNDGVFTTIPGPWPSTAVVMLTKINTGEAAMVIDIKNGFMYFGDSQMFWNQSYLTNGRGLFLNNLMYLIGNASKYGTNFTDLLLEDGQPSAQPAPWDAYWGANAGVPSK